MGVAAVFAGLILWYVLGQLGSVMTIVGVAFFIALAMEPPVVMLVRRGMGRGAATGLVMFSMFAVIGGVVALVGQLFFDQVVSFVKDVPALYDELSQGAFERFGYTLPPSHDLLSEGAQRWGGQAASGIVGASGTVFGGLFTASAVLLVVFYMVASGPAFRAAVCRTFAPARQREVLTVWSVAQQKVADFIISRVALAAICSAVTAVFLLIAHVPYALPLAVFTGVLAQFVPTVGTYIGGALPVVVALTVSPVTALVTLAFIVGYQQVENLLIAPKISQKSMALNPAVAFLAVIAFSAVFGAIGAILSLPVAATVQAVAGAYLNRHELVESELFTDDHHRPRKARRAPGTEAGGVEVSSAGAGAGAPA